MQEFRVPLLLSKSQNPIFVKIGVPMNFPFMKPNVHMAGKFTHPKIEPGTYAYKGQML